MVEQWKRIEDLHKGEIMWICPWATTTALPMFTPSVNRNSTGTPDMTSNTSLQIQKISPKKLKVLSYRPYDREEMENYPFIPGDIIKIQNSDGAEFMKDFAIVLGIAILLILLMFGQCSCKFKIESKPSPPANHPTNPES